MRRGGEAEIKGAPPATHPTPSWVGRGLPEKIFPFTKVETDCAVPVTHGRFIRQMEGEIILMKR